MVRIMKHAAIGPTVISIRSADILSYFLDVNPRGKSAARPESYRRRVAINHPAQRERERHLRQMAAGQLDFSASDPMIWRHRPYVPNFRSLMKHMKRRSRLQCSPLFLGLLSATRQATDDKAEFGRRLYHVH